MVDVTCINWISRSVTIGFFRGGSEVKGTMEHPETVAQGHKAAVNLSQQGVPVSLLEDGESAEVWF